MIDMLVFELRLVGRTAKNVHGKDNVERFKNDCCILLSEWNIANIIRIMKSRNQTLYKEINMLYDKSSEYEWEDKEVK